MNIHCKYDALVKVADLKPHPKNRNQHSFEQIDRLSQILSYQGIRAPIVISKLSGYIVKGHGTLKSIEKNKWTEAPVVYQDFESQEQEYLFLQSDNAIASWAELDLSGIHLDIGDLGPFDLDLLGIKDFQLEPEPNENDTDETPEVPKEAKTKRGELWILGNHRLLIDDCTIEVNVKRLMGNEKADMVFTDPPYGVNEKTNRKSSGRCKLAENQDLQPVYGDESTDTAIKAFNIFSSINGIWWGANYYAHSVPEVGSWLIWDKRNGVASDDNADCEMAWVWNKKPARVFSHLWKGCIRASEKNETKVHPTQKPIVLAEWCFENYGNPQIVLDGFLGSGSTLIACEKTNRRCYGMEIEPLYGDVIIERWQKFSGKEAVREDGVEWSELNG